MVKDLIEFCPDAIEASRVRAHLAANAGAACGGVVIFEGCTRPEHHAEFGDLVELAYQAYGSMALKQMQRIAQTTREHWPIGALAMLHRMGSVPIGEPSVIIGVASAHRAEAFAACRFLIDELKRDVPIWKKEIWQSGAGTWVDPTK